MTHIRRTYGMAVRSRADGAEMPKITETVRSAALRRPLKPSVTRDEVPGFALHVTTQRGFWALSYQPRGINPATGKRWGGGVRHELGDALTMTVAETRTAALAAKALVRQGRDPQRDAKASRASQVAERAVLPQSAGEALDLYEKALMARRQPSEATRRQAIHYARKAVRLMSAEQLALAAIDARMVRVLIETMPGSDGERRHIFGPLGRFLSWCLGARARSSATSATILTARSGRSPARRATMSPRPRSSSASGRRSRTSRSATSSGSCCSSPCAATRPQASAGPRSTFVLGGSASQPTA